MKTHSFVCQILLLIVFGPVFGAVGQVDGEHRLRVMSYNTWYVFAKGEEVAAGKKWIKVQSPDVVALQELTNIKPEKLQELAMGWGHEHSSLLKTKGFSVGLTSRWEIEEIEKGIKGMHHGFLHAKTHGVHYFLVHLSPFKWEVRQKEADILLAKIKPLLRDNERVIVLGDFNAVSPADKQMLAAQTGLLKRKKESDEKNEHVMNLKDGEIDFAVLEAFFDAGLQDPGLPFFTKQEGSIATIPTGIWSETKDTAPATGERIDFILTGPRLSKDVVAGRIDRDGEVNRISDHYPVTLDFLTKPSP